MNHRLLTIVMLAGLLASPGAFARLNVFACEPEWGALAETLGGDRVAVTVATSALQDAHQIQARPSLIAAVRRAGLVMCSGAGLETGWLPLLLRQAGNPAVQDGQPGNLLAANLVTMLDVPQSLDRSQGDIHAQGNPHVITDPRNLRRIAAVLAERLQALDPGGAADYAQRAQAFDAELAQRIAGWEAAAAPLRGLPIVIQHNVWAYLQNWLGLVFVADLEPKPGVPPTSAHLARVLASLQATPARAIVLAAYENPKAAKWLAERTDLPVVVLPYTVGGTDQAGDLFGLYDDTIRRLLEVAP